MASESPTLVRYGKPAAGLLRVGQSFFSENDKALAAAHKHAQMYIAQPRRGTCKLCNAVLPAVPAFVKQEVPYAFCEHCGQLNGLHEDTEAFCRAIYLDPEYDHYYNSNDVAAYRHRVDAIYRPKVEFIRDALALRGLGLGDRTVLDVGAGSGYFVAALEAAGVRHASGIEVSSSQAIYANGMSGKESVRAIPLGGDMAEVRRSDCDLVALVGVLEHLRDPRGMLQTIRDNGNIRYLFLVLPLFSFCVFLEMVFPAVYPRHLVSDHTHLFTPASIEAMEREWGLRRMGEWWFGSDMLDLYRAVRYTIGAAPQMRNMAEQWEDIMRPLIDPMQGQLDMRRMCSEVHLLYEIDRNGSSGQEG